MGKSLVLDDWQREVLENDGDTLLCTGRQVGKTTIFAHKAGKYMLEHPGSQVIVVSLTEDQAQLIIVMVLNFLELENKSLIAKGKKKPTKNTITLKNGSHIIARPVGNTGDAVRGFTGDVLYVDEASRMPELMWIGAKPTLMTTGGQVWMSSTPFGKQGYFWECFVNRTGRWKVFHTSSVDVIESRPISDSWTDDQRVKALEFLDNERADMSELQFGQEYLGLFLEDLRQFFPDDLISARCVLSRDALRVSHTDTVLMGCDLARLGGDESTFEIVVKGGDGRVRQVENIVRSRLLTTQNEKEIIRLAKLWGCERVGVDAGAGTLGVSVVDHLIRDDFMRRKVVPMNNRKVMIDKRSNTTQRLFKEDMYDNLLAMMERGEIDLLKDENLRLSLKSVQWELVNVSGVSKVRIHGKSTHIVEGLVRAAWLAKEKSLNVWVSYV